jgi:hypothetical protein
VREFLSSRNGLILIGFLALAGYYLWTEHPAHVVAALPALVLLACPLMHFFMHRGHGGHGGGHDHEKDAPRRHKD